MRNTPKNRAFLLSIAAATLLAGGPLTQAATGEFTVYPTYVHGTNHDWIIRTVAQGDSVEESFTIENLTAASLTLNLGIAEAIEENGAFTTTENQPSQHLALWSSINTIDTTSLTLEPHEKKNIPLTLKIPANAAEGEYKAAILAAKSTTNNANVQIVTRIGVRMYIQVVKAAPLSANIFTSEKYSSTLFFGLSLAALFGSVLYNIIYYREQKKHA